VGIKHVAVVGMNALPEKRIAFSPGHGLEVNEIGS